MKVSIITASYNSEKTIRKAIQSVISQTYKDIEYIIVDGASSDNTLNIVHEYQDKISTIISEKDSGIYHAFNKGIEIASGDIVGFLNSDDCFANEHVIEEIVLHFKKTNCDVVYGDLIYQKEEQNIRHWKSNHFKEKSLNMDGCLLILLCIAKNTFIINSEHLTKDLKYLPTMTLFFVFSVAKK
jgi:glycosyltransferase involved in cell wall biosynthesis